MKYIELGLERKAKPLQAQNPFNGLSVGSWVFANGSIIYSASHSHPRGAFPRPRVARVLERRSITKGCNTHKDITLFLNMAIFRKFEDNSSISISSNYNKIKAVTNTLI